jgi:hypothetical protein
MAKSVLSTADLNTGEKMKMLRPCEQNDPPVGTEGIVSEIGHDGIVMIRWDGGNRDWCQFPYAWQLGRVE